MWVMCIAQLHMSVPINVTERLLRRDELVKYIAMDERHASSLLNIRLLVFSSSDHATINAASSYSLDCNSIHRGERCSIEFFLI